MAKIEKLTPEQEEQLVEARQEWFDIGSSCKPADQPAAERAVKDMYGCINEEEPMIIWASSPAMACFFIGLMKDRDALKRFFFKALEERIANRGYEGSFSLSDRIVQEGGADCMKQLVDLMVSQIFGIFTADDWGKLRERLVDILDLGAWARSVLVDHGKGTISDEEAMKLRGAMGEAVDGIFATLNSDEDSKEWKFIAEKKNRYSIAPKVSNRDSKMKGAINKLLQRSEENMDSGKLIKVLSGVLQEVVEAYFASPVVTPEMRALEPALGAFCELMGKEEDSEAHQLTILAITRRIYDALPAIGAEDVDLSSLTPSLIGALAENLRVALDGQIGQGLTLGDSPIYDAIGGVLWDVLDTAFSRALRAREYSVELGDPLGDALTWFGSNGAYWIGFYDFCGTLVDYKEDDAKKLAMHVELAKSAFWIWPYKGHCIVCDRPAEIHWSEGEIRDRRLHKDGGPAVRFRDGWGVWSLNGVRVPQWLAETPDSQLRPEKIKDIDNAEVRREFVRKVGIERICRALGAKEIDKARPEIDGKKIGYRLLELRIGTQTMRYLEMENPSVEGVIHVERVRDDCKSVQDAILFRNGFENMKVDEKDGVDWFQHGDVVIVPQDAKSVKPWPKWIA